MNQRKGSIFNFLVPCHTILEHIASFRCAFHVWVELKASRKSSEDFYRPFSSLHRVHSPSLRLVVLRGVFNIHQILSFYEIAYFWHLSVIVLIDSYMDARSFGERYTVVFNLIPSYIQDTTQEL